MGDSKCIFLALFMHKGSIQITDVKLEECEGSPRKSLLQVTTIDYLKKKTKKPYLKALRRAPRKVNSEDSWGVTLKKELTL